MWLQRIAQIDTIFCVLPSAVTCAYDYSQGGGKMKGEMSVFVLQQSSSEDD